MERGKLARLMPAPGPNVRQALEAGLRKILSKIGISCWPGYHGAQIFEGQSQSASDLISLASRATTKARVAGLKPGRSGSETLAFHARPYPGAEPQQVGVHGLSSIPHGGEFHLNSPEMAKALHGRRSLQAWLRIHFSTSAPCSSTGRSRAWRPCLNEAGPPTPAARPGGEVKSICSRFCTGGMSLGALSREAHEVSGRRLNRIGGQSATVGEGGEEFPPASAP